MIKFHYFEDACHGLIIKTLPIDDILDSAIELLEADQDLLDVLQVSVMLTPQPLELFHILVTSLTRFSYHLGQLLA